MISGFAVDPMHVLDLSVCQDLISKIKEVVDKTRAVKASFYKMHKCESSVFTPDAGSWTVPYPRNLIELRRLCLFIFCCPFLSHVFFLAGLVKFMVDDIDRDIPDFETFPRRWKSRTYRLYITYFAVPELEAHYKDMGAEGLFLFQQVKILCHAIRLVNGTSSQPLPPENISQAGLLFKLFFENMVEHYGPIWATQSKHNVLHLHEDLKLFACELDRNAVYKEESFHNKWAKLFQSGPKADVQIA